jgi:alpha-maltose-1-phosphate synthase
MLHYGSQFANALSKMARVTVVLPSYVEGSLYHEKEMTLLRIHSDPTLRDFLLDSLNIFQHVRLIRAIIRENPDIIQILDNHPWYIPYGLLFKILGYTIYTIQHDPFPHSWEKNGFRQRIAILVNRFLRTMSNHLIVHEESMREKVIETYRLPREKVISIPHGSYTMFSEEKSLSEKEKGTFLFFGRIVEYKWLDILIEAVRLLKDSYEKPFRLIIAGEGDISKYRESISALWDCIEVHHEFIPDAYISGYFLRSQFVVLPYRDATASGVIPLAYSFSLPVIATDVWVLGAYVEDGVTGLLIESESPLVLAENIQKFLDNPKLAEELWENGFEFQKKHLSWEGIVRKIYFP